MTLHLEWLKLYKSGSIIEYEQTLTVRNWFINWFTKFRDNAKEFGSNKDATVSRYEDHIDSFLVYTDATGLSDLPMEKFEPEHLKKIPLFRITQTRYGKKDGVAITKQGANRDLKFIKCRFKEAHEEGVIPKNIAKDVSGFKLPVQEQQELLTPEQILEVLDCIEEQEARDIVETTALIGSRPGGIGSPEVGKH
jgi:hypothetical protein